MAADPAPYVFAPHERPMFPGSPANPEHPNIRRHAYFLIGCLIGMTAGLGSALVTVNLNFAQGTLGLDSDESAWLTAAYLMPNVTANLLLVKYRQQFGLQPFIRYTLAAFAATSVLHLFVHDFWTAVVVRAMSGLAGAGLFSLTLYYILQSKPAPKRIAAVMIAICVPQFGIPLARAISPHLLMTGDWHMLYWFELAFVLATLAAVMTLPLPPSEREKVFEPLDFLTFSLLAPGLCLLVAAFSLGRVEWWLERDWIGYALAGSAALIAAAVLVEHHRANPLINTRWLGQREMVRLIAVAASVRILLSEQSFGSVGFLGTVGMTNDQMITLNLIILAASLAGLTFAVKTFRPQSVGVPIVGASMLIAIGAFMDAGANNLSRPEDFYLSQAIIGFASIIFLAEAMAIGIARTLLAGGGSLIGFVVLFSLSQNLGGLAGTSLLGTFQTVRQNFHSHELVQQITLTDPLVAANIAAGARSVSGVIGDTALRGAEGVTLLAQQVAREASILAYNDVFLLISILATLNVIWGIAIRRSMWRRGEVSPVVQLQQLIQQRAAQMAKAQAEAEAQAKTGAGADAKAGNGQ